MKVDKEIEVERLQTNIMLSRKYSHWFTDNERGIFPLFDKDVDDNWSYIWHGKTNNKYIGVLENHTDEISFPTLVILPQILNQDWFLSIINSDIYHQGRVLQYINPDRKILLPADHLYFNSRIIIDNIPPI